jgi:predicted transcriptional regulator
MKIGERSMRVNARLDEQAQQQLEYLTQATGQSVSVILRESVARYYVEVKAQRRPRMKFVDLGQADEVNAGAGPTSRRNVAKSVTSREAMARPSTGLDDRRR